MGLLKANTHGRLNSAVKPVNPETKGADLQRASMNFHTTFTSTDQRQQSWGFVSQAFFLACLFDLHSNSDFLLLLTLIFSLCWVISLPVPLVPVSICRTVCKQAVFLHKTCFFGSLTVHTAAHNSYTPVKHLCIAVACKLPPQSLYSKWIDGHNRTKCFQH